MKRHTRYVPWGGSRDGALHILEGVVSVCESGRCPKHESDCTCTHEIPDWHRAGVILNIEGQKYTIGSGKNLIYDPKAHGEFLIFKDKCQIECDSSGTFWLHSLGYSETFVNGKLIEVSPVKLKFGDIFYFSCILSQLWNPHLQKRRGNELYRRNGSGRVFPVFKFERLARRMKLKRKERLTTQEEKESKSKTNSQEYLKFSTTCTTHSIFDNSVILSKIFEYVSNPINLKDLFNCRLVSHRWKLVASETLQKHFVLQFTIVADELSQTSNKISNRLHWKSHRMKEQHFDEWKVDIWPNKYGSTPPRDNYERNETMIKFYRDFSSFLKPSLHPLKRLDMNIDYLFPISLLLSKFSSSLEELTIQINMLWISDEATTFNDFPKTFPKLRKLTLHFSISGDDDDFAKICKSSSLAQLLHAVSGIESLILRNYAKLPIDFDYFVKLRKIKIYGRPYYGVYSLHLEDCLRQLNTLPRGQITSFKLVVEEMEMEGSRYAVEGNLLQFLQIQHSHLETLEISIASYRSSLKIPGCMPSLKKLWISCDEEFVWGIKLHGEISKSSGGFTEGFNPSLLPMIMLDGKNCCHKSCNCDIKKSPTDLSLAFGKFDLNNEFVAFIPNVEKIWAWT